jgi:rSAM/selenodomain-associated transferase 2
LLVKISVIIPTWNEAASIGPLVRYVLGHGSDSIAEVIVVDGASDDDTLERATQAGAFTLNCPERCRAIQMNTGAKYATGEILYFIHADVKLIPSFAVDVMEAIREGYDSGCYRYAFDSTKYILRINGYFTRFEGLMCRGGDQTLFVTRSAFDGLDGFDGNFSIMEDYDFISRLRKKYRFKIIPKNVIVSARKYETNSWLRVQLANLSVFIMYFLRRPPRKMQLFYKRVLRYR